MDKFIVFAYCMSTRGKWKFFGLGLGVLILAGLIFVGGRVWRTEVSVAGVERGLAVRAVPGVVRVAAARTVELRTEVAGKISESALEVGATVEVGEPLLRLDEMELRHALERVRLDMEAEEALSEIGSLLRYDLETLREELAGKEGQAPRREVDALKRRIARLVDEIALEEIRERRRLQGLKHERALLEEELKKMTLNAPVDGQVLEILAYPGDVVGARAVVARLLSEERVIEASLSEENFAGVEVGQAATVRFLSYGSRLFPAEVSKVLPAADPETQRYTIHLDVEMPEELMVPGITGEVSIVLAEREGALVIPRRALVGREVFVVRNGRARSREVRTGFVSLNNVEILEGLEEGDVVAVENLDRLRDGDRVRVRSNE